MSAIILRRPATLLFAALALAACARSETTAPRGGGDTPPDTSTTTPPPPPPVVTVASVELVAPEGPSVTKGLMRQIRAVVRAADGRVLEGRAISWSSADATIATVDGYGNAVGRAAGTVTITATSEGKQGTLALTVVPVMTRRIELSADDVTIEWGATRLVDALAVGTDGGAIQDRPVVWASADPAIAAVDEHGRIIARRGGTTVVTASLDGVTARVIVRVPLVQFHQLVRLDGRLLPTTIDESRTTLDSTANVYHYRRSWRVATTGSLVYSTTDDKYRQELRVTTYEHECTAWNGETICTMPRVVAEPVYVDQGRRQVDGWGMLTLVSNNGHAPVLVRNGPTANAVETTQRFTGITPLLTFSFVR